MAAAVGITCRLFVHETSRWVNPCIYLAIGWGMATSYPTLVRAVGQRPVRLIWIGGLLYTIGATFFIIGWPVGWPGIFGAHELLHLFVMGGSLAHYCFIWKYVVPYRRVVAVPAPELEPALA
jgi:hemolysin III